MGQIKSGTCTSCAPNGTWNSTDYGLFYRYEVAFDNGDTGDALTKTEAPPFGVGSVEWYELQPGRGGKPNKIKKRRDPNADQQSAPAPQAAGQQAPAQQAPAPAEVTGQPVASESISIVGSSRDLQIVRQSCLKTTENFVREGRVPPRDLLIFSNRLVQYCMDGLAYPIEFERKAKHND